LKYDSEEDEKQKKLKNIHIKLKEINSDIHGQIFKEK
jgi:hypothetical protein